MSAERDLADEFPEIESPDGRRLRGTQIAAGQRFGRLVAIRPTPPRGKSRSLHWQFRCDCGNFCVQKVARVAAGRYVSCGCKHRETLETFTAKAKARSAAAAAQGRGRLAAERDLAEAIHHEIISPERVDDAVDLWKQYPDLDDRSRMWRVLARTSASAIDAVLARRQSEAARTGPWETSPGEAVIQAARKVDAAYDKYHAAAYDKGAAAMLLYGALDELSDALNRLPPAAIAAARTGPWDGPQEEDGYPGSLVPRKRGTP